MLPSRPRVKNHQWRLLIFIDTVPVRSYSLAMRRLCSLCLCLCLIIAVFANFFPGSLRAQVDSNIGDGTLRRIRVPILMYHYVSPLPEDADEVREDLTITPDLFQQHVAYLQREGYTTISLYDLDAALLTGAPLPEKPVILTFDDGYSDHYEYVFPMLQSAGLTATFFVITGPVDVRQPGYLTWEQVAEMAAAGMHMEPHTKHHPSLDERSHDFLVYEMLGSRESLTAHTGQPALMFSYPAGRYDGLTLAVAQGLGIQRAVTTQPGLLHTTDNRLELPRVRVHGGTTAAGLAYLLGGGWLD